MLFKSKLIACSIALCLSSSVFALQQTLCPDINDIKAEGVTVAEELGFQYYLSYNVSLYNTDSAWGFFMAPIAGSSAEDALGEANQWLNTMSAPGVFEQQAGVSLCTYETGRPDIIAAAVKGEMPGFISPATMKQAYSAIR